jgi:hypothetical protein
VPGEGERIEAGDPGEMCKFHVVQVVVGLKALISVT